MAFPRKDEGQEKSKTTESDFYFSVVLFNFFPFFHNQRTFTLAKNLVLVKATCYPCGLWNTKRFSRVSLELCIRGNSKFVCSSSFPNFSRSSTRSTNASWDGLQTELISIQRPFWLIYYHFLKLLKHSHEETPEVL